MAKNCLIGLFIFLICPDVGCCYLDNDRLVLESPPVFVDSIASDCVFPATHSYFHLSIDFSSPFGKPVKNILDWISVTIFLTPFFYLGDAVPDNKGVMILTEQFVMPFTQIRSDDLVIS